MFWGKINWESEKKNVSEANIKLQPFKIHSIGMKIQKMNRS